MLCLSTHQHIIVHDLILTAPQFMERTACKHHRLRFMGLGIYAAMPSYQKQCEHSRRRVW